MKRFILHVGFHKTATSSIQQTLANNVEELSKKGFHYPIFLNGDTKIINHSIPFYSSYCDKPELYHINIKNGDIDKLEEVNQSYKSQISEILKDDRDVIISGEDISVLPAESLSLIRNMIIEAGFSLEVYCSVRTPYSFSCSDLQERIKTHIGTLSDVSVSKKSHYVDKLKKVFGDNVNFYSFEKDCAHSDPVSAFLERIGVDKGELVIANSNEGFGNQSTRLLSYLNEYFPNIVDGRLNPKGRGFFAESADTEKFLLSESEFALIENDIANENKELCDLLGSEFCDKDIKLSKQTKLETEVAVRLYNLYAKPHTSKLIFSYIYKNSNFNFMEFMAGLHQSADVYRDAALSIEKMDSIIALKCMAKAKVLRPGGPLINKKFDEISKSVLKEIKVGIGVITYNRIDELKKTVEKIKKYTTNNYELVVADDGSPDGSATWCYENNVKVVAGKNKGVVRNKNRALYYLNEEANCDVVLIIEDDCRPEKQAWNEEWIISSILWGHINFAHNRIINIHDAVLSGDGTPTTPYLCTLVTGQCTGCSKEALNKVGYLDPRFEGYGAGHVEWTERFVLNKYNGKGSSEKIFPAINTGLSSDDAPTYKDEEQLRKNRALKSTISGDLSYRFPWKDENEKNEFTSEMQGVA